MKGKKAYKGLPMEGAIASWYARTTFKDLKRHKGMAARLAGEIPAGGSVLEIAPGPGYFCVELAKLGAFRITGLDISKSFVAIATRNAARAGIAADFRQGNASAMPFADGTFDFVFCQAAFKNFAEPVAAIAEMHRVLKPGGLAVIVDMRSDASREAMDREVNGMGLGRINAALTGWTFRQMLVKSAYGVAEMESMIAQTPFGEGGIEVDGIGFQVRLRKRAQSRDSRAAS
jgi:ubiquinone/menaquinone biosynthesis C-methylase UbiE